MKKIVGAATLAGLLAGAAFADISFSYSGKNYFSNSGNSLNYDGGLRTDCLSLSINQSNYGATFDVDVKTNNMVLDEYYGWMTFAPISTTFTAGVWNSRYVNRIVTDKRGVDFDEQDFELFKPGVINAYKYRDDNTEGDDVLKKRRQNVAFDSDNLTMGALAMFAAYTNTALPGTLMVKLGLVDVSGKAKDSTNDLFSRNKGGDAHLSPEGAWSDNTNADTSLKVWSGFAGEVAYRQENLFAVNLAIRSYESHTLSAALFFSPLMVERLQATAGLTVGVNAAGFTTNGPGQDTGKGRQVIHQDEGTWGVEWAIDLRARYAFSDRLAVTTMHNFSSYLTNLEVDRLDWPNGYEGDNTKWEKNDFAMWNQLNLTYDFAESLTAGFTVQHLATDLDQSYTSHNHIWVSPNLQIKANDNAKVTVVSRAHFQNVGARDEGICLIHKKDDGHGADRPAYRFALTIPVIFTFNY